MRNKTSRRYGFSWEDGHPFAMRVRTKNGKNDGKILRYVDLKRDLDIDYHEGSSIEITDGELTPYCDPDSITRVLLCAPTEAGKSTLVGNMVSTMLREDPKKNIYVFSRLKEDKALDDLPHLKRVIVDDNFCDDEYDLEDYENSICIFDDYETFRNKKVVKAIGELKDMMLETGRHNFIHTFYTSHFALNGPKTRQALLECNYVFFFPVGGTRGTLLNVLKSKYGFDKMKLNKISEIMEECDWICIRTRAPCFIFYPNGSYLI